VGTKYPFKNMHTIRPQNMTSPVKSCSRSFRKFLVFALLLTTIFSYHSYAAPTVMLNGEQTFYPSNLNIDLLEDKERQWDINQIASLEFSDRFVPNENASINLGYPLTPYWVRVRVKNGTNPDLRWFLEVSGFVTLLDSVILYLPKKEGGYTEKSTGVLLPFDSREIKHHNYLFSLTLNPDEEQTLYLRIDSWGMMIFNVNFWESGTFRTTDHDNQAVLSFYYGIMLAMILYNIFLYISIRDRSYLYYVLFISSFTIYQLSLGGMGFQYLWPETPWWNHQILFFAGLFGIFGIKFNTLFLKTEVYLPRFHKFLMLIMGYFVILLLIQPLMAKTTLNQLLVAGLLIWVIAMIGSGLMCYSKGYKPAIFYLGAWIGLLITFVIFILGLENILPFNRFTQYSVQVGSAFEAILLSFGLAYRFNLIKKEKEEAQSKVLQAVQKEEETLKKMDALKDEFLANTSHELRTPLAGIIGLSETLLEQSEKGQQNHLKMIIESGKRLSRLVNDILDFSKLKHNDLGLQRKAVDLKKAVDLVFHLSQPLVKNKQLVLVNAIEDDLLPLSADEDRILQILFNLVGNAIKFTSFGEIRITAGLRDGMIDVCIADTGIGITEENLKSVFNTFEQGDASISRKYGGTGLGLPLSKLLVELHGGEMRVESTLGEGSVFSFFIPLYEGEIIPQEPLNLSLNTADLPVFVERGKAVQTVPEGDCKAHILVVDDDEINLQVLQDHLSHQNYQVTTALEGQEALDILETTPGIDLILLDVMMPGLNGYEVCMKIRETFTSYEIPILMLTARTRTGDLVTGMQAGANDYLSKPILREELLARVQNHLELKESVINLKENERLTEEVIRREQAERKLIFQQKRLLRILDSAGEGIISCTQALEIIFSNQKSEVQSGYTTQELSGLYVSHLFPEITTLLNGSDSSRSKKISTNLQTKEGGEQGVQISFITLEGEPGYLISIYEADSPTVSGKDNIGSDPEEDQTGFERQYLEDTAHALTQTLEQGNSDMFREVRYLPPQLDDLEPNLSSALIEEPDEIKIRHDLVEILSKTIHYWKSGTQKSKSDLATESGIWNASIDPQGTWRTRTLDRYLKVETLPQKPKWSDVIQTTYFVLSSTPEINAALKQELESDIEKFSSTLRTLYHN
jgi:two-component system, sensor histidine kinase LadS